MNKNTTSPFLTAYEYNFQLHSKHLKQTNFCCISMYDLFMSYLKSDDCFCQNNQYSQEINWWFI